MHINEAKYKTLAVKVKGTTVHIKIVEIVAKALKKKEETILKAMKEGEVVMDLIN